MRLFGQDRALFQLLDDQAELCCDAAKAFQDLIVDYGQVERHAQRLKEIESAADEKIRALFNRVDATFVTPLDKEDLHALSSELDDITDSIEAAASRFVLFHISEPREDVARLAEVVVNITNCLRQAINALSDLHNKTAITEALEAAHRSESTGDMLFRQALGNLFNTPMEMPLTVIKWKDIYERIEKAIDKSEDVASRIGSILVKYA